MKHIKDKIIEEIQCVEKEIEESGKFHEEQLSLVCRLAKTLYYLERVSISEAQLSNQSSAAKLANGK
jgi:hypothetical protein